MENNFQIKNIWEKNPKWSQVMKTAIKRQRLFARKANEEERLSVFKVMRLPSCGELKGNDSIPCDRVYNLQTKISLPPILGNEIITDVYNI